MSTPTDSDIKEAESLKKLGNEAFAKQEFKKAAKIYRDALKLHFNATLLSNRAMCFIKLQDWDRAVRDCSEALRLAALEPKLEVKLYYRKGIAYKGQGKLNQSLASFKKALEIDPENSAAKISIEQVKQEIQSRKLLHIPIEVVDKLPDEVSRLFKGPKGSIPENKALIEREIEGLFGDKSKENSSNKKAEASPNESIKPKPFIERPTMHYLSTLSSISPEKKANAYKLVINLPASEYIDLFSSAGVDSDFLPFFLEAAHESAVRGESFVSDWSSKILNLLSTFEKMPRFDLALIFCSRRDIDGLLQKVKEISNELYGKYKKYL